MRSCGHDFEKKEDLIEHFIHKHNFNSLNESNHKIIFKCGFCEKKFESYDQIMKHFTKFHFESNRFTVSFRII